MIICEKINCITGKFNTCFLIICLWCKSNNPTLSSDTSSATILNGSTTPSDTTPYEDDSYMNKTLSLKIDNQEVDAYWLDNDSVKALKELAKDRLTI